MMRTFRPSRPILVALALAACDSGAVNAVDLRQVRARSLATDVAPFPDVVALPRGFAPEGIAFGTGTTFYVGSIFTGAIFRADARTGDGGLLVPPLDGREALGIEYDARRNRLFVAGGYTGKTFVYDASTGATLGEYTLADPTAGPTDINDLAIARDAVYVTDDARPVIYRIPLGAGGALPSAGSVQEIPLTGDFTFVPGGINANGIVTTPDESQLIIANTWTAAVYRVDPASGVATTIPIEGGPVEAGDGLVRRGHTLYVVQGPYDRVAVVRLDADFGSGVLERTITSPALAFPSTIAPFGDALYAVNGRFDVEPGPSVEYQVVRLRRTDGEH